MIDADTHEYTYISILDIFHENNKNHIKNNIYPFFLNTPLGPLQLLLGQIAMFPWTSYALYAWT
jgi:hypothetical protein